MAAVRYNSGAMLEWWQALTGILIAGVLGFLSALVTASFQNKWSTQTARESAEREIEARRQAEERTAAREYRKQKVRPILEFIDGVATLYAAGLLQLAAEQVITDPDLKALYERLRERDSAQVSDNAMLDSIIQGHRAELLTPSDDIRRALLAVEGSIGNVTLKRGEPDDLAADLRLRMAKLSDLVGTYISQD